MTRLIYTVFIWLIPFCVTAKIIVVGKNQPVATIRQALSICAPGDTIKVEPGVYREGTIEIRKPVTILGTGLPVLDGQNKFEILNIESHSVEINGMVLKDSRHSSSEDYAAIQVTNGKEIRIVNNHIQNAHFGIHLSNSSYCILSGNQIEGKAVSEQSAGNGIHIWKSNHIQVKGNQVQGHRDGIYFEFVTDSDIRDNFSGNNLRYGLHFMFSNNDDYVHNVFHHNGTGVAVMYTKNVKMLNNTFSDNWGTASYAILLKDITDSYLIGNRFLNNTIGIFMEGGNRIEVRRNLFKKNGWAMKVQANCTDNEFTQNNFFGNSFDVSTNGSSTMSVFRRNYWDRYEGYDLDKNGVGDIPFHPVSLYSMIIEQNPESAMLLRSFIVTLLDKVEKAMPSLTPENLVDKEPLMKPVNL